MPLEGVSRGFKDISFSFRQHPITGDLVTLTNENAIGRSVRNLVLTNLSERPFQRLVGTDIQKAVFENFDSITASIIETRIRGVLVNYEPRVSVGEIKVFHNNDSGTVECAIQYEIIGQSQSLQEITFALESVR